MRLASGMVSVVNLASSAAFYLVIPANAGRGFIANSACAGPKGNNPETSCLGIARRTESAEIFCFAPSGESLLSIGGRPPPQKGTKKACPAYGPDGAGLPSRIPPPRRPELGVPPRAYVPVAHRGSRDIHVA
ncbi:hypothetical protein Pssp01_53060 [Pseudomonas sp. NBRC 100443]|nr:hypothetical protein Pssp01_53060 [Pseudomonas sp. NBRC 100443]